VEFVMLRRAGGSLTLTIPKVFARELGLAEGGKVGVSVAEGKLIADPAAERRPRYTLEELLAQCDPSAPRSEEDEAWLNDRPRGSEIL
jgi:antitoxin ChpS